MRWSVFDFKVPAVSREKLCLDSNPLICGTYPCTQDGACRAVRNPDLGFFRRRVRTNASFIKRVNHSISSTAAKLGVFIQRRAARPRVRFAGHSRNPIEPVIYRFDPVRGTPSVRQAGLSVARDLFTSPKLPVVPTVSLLTFVYVRLRVFVARTSQDEEEEEIFA